MSTKRCNVNCCVYGCHSKKGRERHLSFHRFPIETSGHVYITNKDGMQEKIDKRKAWENVLLMGNRTTPTMKVCSLHFRKDHFILPDYPTKNPRLKKDAIPSENLPKQSISTSEPCGSRGKRSSKLTMNVEKKKTDENLENSTCIPTLPRTFATLEKTEQVAMSGLLQLVNSPSQGTLTEEKGTQVTSGDVLIPFIISIDTREKLNSLTGLNSFELLNSIVLIFKRHFSEVRVRKLTVKEQIILTLMKLKTGLRYVVLSALFGVITSKTCKVVFHSTISKLALILKPVIYWPTQEEIKNNLPICFKQFSNLRVIVDSTELSVQKAKCLCCRIRTYSHSKGYQTIKFMTGVTPAGLISFVSKAYGGSASDKAIFEQSGLINKLDVVQDVVMVDKGVYIDDILATHFIKLIRLTYLKNKKPLLEQESKRNIEIAKAHVHMIRTNKRIKMFAIFCKPLHWTLVPKIEEIFTVVCAILNLSSPIVSEDKFLK